MNEQAMITQRQRGRHGSMLLEFILVFPLVLALIMACIQLAHIWMARQVVHYAAFCAARAALVGEAGEEDPVAQEAGERVCAWAVKGHMPGEADLDLPGWGGIPGSGAYHRKTRVQDGPGGGAWNLGYVVEHQFGLIVPVAGPMIAWMVDPWAEDEEWLERRADDTGNIGNADLLRHPHVLFREPVVLPKPYKVVTPTDW